MSLQLDVGTVTITSDGSGDFELESWEPGPSQRQNDYATSRHADGAVLTNSTRPISTAQLTVRVSGTDLDDAFVNALALQDSLDNGGAEYVLSESFGTTTWLEYSCFPATVRIIRDPVLMEEGLFLVSASIPHWSPPTVVPAP
jgi:hypothetical protein